MIRENKQGGGVRIELKGERFESLSSEKPESETQLDNLGGVVFIIGRRCVCE